MAGATLSREPAVTLLSQRPITWYLRYDKYRVILCANSRSLTTSPAQHTAGFDDDHRPFSCEAYNQLMRSNSARAFVQLGINILKVKR
jgi:hypothetical protein